jgi:hypothetical protein
MRAMKAQDAAVTLARGRIAFGAMFLLAPGLAGRLWIGDDARRPAVKVLTRALGGRDLAIGLGVVIALDRGGPVRGWLEAGVLADAVDCAAALLAGDSLPENARSGVILVAAVSAGLGAVLARALDQPPAAGGVHAPEAALTGHH